MAFVKRDGANNIVAVYARPQPGSAVERLNDDDPDVIAFNNRAVPDGLDDIRNANSLPELKAAILAVLTR